MLEYTKKVIVKECFVGWNYMDLTITGRIIKSIRKRWFRKPKEVFEIELCVPYIQNPRWVREKNTNTRLQCATDMLRHELSEYIVNKYDTTEYSIYYK